MTEIEPTNTIDFDDEIEPTYLPDTEPFEWKWSIVKVKIFNFACFIGEIVASVLGLEDSIFQDVADSMTEDDWKAAEELNRERDENDKMHIINNKINGVEAGDTSTITTNNNNNNDNNHSNKNNSNNTNVDGDGINVNQIDLQENK